MPLQLLHHFELGSDASQNSQEGVPERILPNRF
jgi:hypothetical protein